MVDEEDDSLLELLEVVLLEELLVDEVVEDEVHEVDDEVEVE